MTLRLLAACSLLSFAAAAQLPAPPPSLPARDRAFDKMLDENVRDGLVYYNAVRGMRGMLAGYIASLDVSPARFDAMSRGDQMALLINAYNAIALHTVADNFPIRQRVDTFPAKSIRQIPGAFERKHRVAGRSVSLDELERWLLDSYGDPRVVFALGRGAIGGGRLRSEAYIGDRIDEQLASAAAEFVTRHGHFRIDRAAGVVVVSPLYSWRDDEFAAAYGDKADPVFAERSPIERAVLALTLEHLFQSEQEWLKENNFRMEFGSFDWSLNEL